MTDDEKPALPCSDKLAFDTKLQAEATATVVAYRYGTSVYPYVCRYCGLWHLSSGLATSKL